MSDSSSSTGVPFYQKLSNHPAMTAARRTELLEHFYGLQLRLIDALADYMVPLFRYFARELEARNTQNDAEEPIEEATNARLSRLKASQLRQIAKMLMEFRQAYERADAEAIRVGQSQFRELLLGFDYALLSTLSSPAFLEPRQKFILDEAKTAAIVAQIREVVAQADEDRNALFKGNWRLVADIARRFQAFGSKLDLDEMIQEGNTGLLAAIDKFNPRLNLQLSTLAANWIQAKIRRGLDNLSETIRTPVYKRQRRKQVQRAEMELLLESDKGNKSSNAVSKSGTQAPQGLLSGTERLFGRAIDDKAIARRTGITVDEVRELRRLYPETVSIHATFDGSGEDDKQERGELIADKSHDEETPVRDKADRKLFFDLLTRLVDDLPLIYQVVLAGLNGLPIRKQCLLKLVMERFEVVKRRGEAIGKGSGVFSKVPVQVFK